MSADVTKSYAIDPHSDTWRAVEALCEQHLRTHRFNLESQGLPPDETEYARGSINELKLVLELAEPAQTPPEVVVGMVEGY